MLRAGVFVFVVILISAFVYSGAPFNFFLQDDFFFLKMTNINSFGQFVDFFSMDRPYGFWRPIGKDLFFFVNQKLFGLNPVPFHFFATFLFFANIVLVFILAKLLSSKRIVAGLAAFFYGVSAAHFTSLYWSSPVENIFAAFFYFLTLILYLKKQSVFAVLAFIFCLMSMELAVTLPFVLVVYELLIGRRNFKRTLIFFVILGLYFAFRLLLGNFAPKLGIYAPVLDPISIANSLRWYVLWSLGLPEMFVDYVSGLTVNPNLWRFYLAPTVVILGLFVVLMAILLFEFRRVYKNRLFLFALVFFALAIGPVLILPWHKFTFYLTIAQFGTALALALIIARPWSIRLALPMVIFFLLNWSTVLLSERTSPVVNRARLAKKITTDIKKNYPVVDRNQIFYFVNHPDSPFISKEWGFSSNQANVALGGESGVQVLYNNPDIWVFYEDVEKLPPGARNVVTIVAPVTY